MDTDPLVDILCSYFPDPERPSTRVTAELAIEELLSHGDDVMFRLARSLIARGVSRSSFAQFAEATYDTITDGDI